MTRNSNGNVTVYVDNIKNNVTIFRDRCEIGVLRSSPNHR